MAEIVLGLGSSHAPQLALPPAEWWRRADHDRKNPELWYEGRIMSFAQLADERAGEHFERELTPEKFEARFAACQAAIAALGETLDRVKLDVAVIVGDDQHECFLDDNMPSIAIYAGDTVDTEPLGPDSGEYAAAPPELSRYPQSRTANPCVPALSQHLFDAFIGAGFDPAYSRRLPAGKHGGHSIGHAFSYVYRRVMQDRVIPNVPIFLNTYFPPNQPTPRRCYELGRSLRRALAAWDGDQRVALIASGGLTHFVIEEDVDRRILDAFAARDEAAITDMPLNWFNSGNSEIRNWMVVAGALADDGLVMHLVDYVPCYRTEGGTGCAMAFARWD